MRAISAKRAGRGRSQDMSQEAALLSTGTHGVSANECSVQGLKSEHLAGLQSWHGYSFTGSDARDFGEEGWERGGSQEVKITTGTHGVSELECSSQGLQSKDGYLKCPDPSSRRRVSQKDGLR